MLPLVIFLGLELGKRMTEGKAEEARATLSGIATQAKAATGQDSGLAEDDAPAEGFFGRIAEVGGKVKGYAKTAVVLTTSADDLLKAALTLIGIFILQNLILPAMLFWGIWTLLKRNYIVESVTEKTQAHIQNVRDAALQVADDLMPAITDGRPLHDAER